MNRSIWNKLVNEEPLDAAECLLLEQMLESGDGSPVSQHLKDSRSMEPSLAWRSGLNQQLRQMAPARPRPIIRWIALGAAATCTLMLWMAFGNEKGSASVPASSYQTAEHYEVAPNELTEVLISAHQADEAQTSMGYRPPKSSKTRLASYQQW